MGTKTKALKDFVEKHEAEMAVVKEKFNETKKNRKKIQVEYKKQLETMKENPDYLAALKKLNPGDPDESEKGENLAKPQQIDNAVDVEGENEEEKSDEEGLEDEDVYEHYLPDD